MKNHSEMGGGAGFEKVEYVLLPTASRRAKEIRAKKEVGHKMEDCIGGKAYTEEFVLNAIEEVRAHEEGILANLEGMDTHERKRRETATKLAKCLEAIILNVKSWFGPTSTIYPATKFGIIPKKVA